MKRKIAFILVTLIIMMSVSRFIIRIVDATVQIDDDIGILIILLILLNTAIAALSYGLYKRTSRGRNL